MPIRIAMQENPSKKARIISLKLYMFELKSLLFATRSILVKITPSIIIVKPHKITRAERIVTKRAGLFRSVQHILFLF